MCLGVHLFLYVDIQLWQPRSLKGAYLGKHGWLKPIALIYFLSDFLNIPFLSLCLWYLCMISLPYPVPSPVRVPFIFINHLSFAYTFLLQPQFCSVLSLIFVWMSFLLLLLKGWFFHKLCPFIFFFKNISNYFPYQRSIACAYWGLWSLSGALHFMFWGRFVI